MKLQDLFFYGGRTHAQYPLFVLMFSLFIIGFAIYGLQNLELTSDPIDLWVSPKSKLNKIRKEKISDFDQDYRIENLFFTPRDQSKKDIINKDALKELWYAEKLFKEAPYEDGEANNILDLCQTAFVDGNCITQSPMNYWQGDLNRMLNDSDIKETIACEKVVDPKSTMACMDEHSLPVYKKAVFGNIDEKEIDSNCFTQDESNPCVRTRISAESLSITYLLKGYIKLQTKAEFWEQNILQKYIEMFNKNQDSSFMQKYFKDLEVIPLTLKINYMSQRSIEDELFNETKQNYFVVIVSYIVMFIYISFSLGKFYNKIESNFLLAFMGILYIISSVVIGFSVFGYLGIKASLITLEVIPFLILAIGVDNMFLIYHSIYRVPSNDVMVKVPVGLRNIGSSIVLSTFTQILTFCCGFYIEIPALTTFCLCAICCLIANFLIQVTVWPAIISIDLRRKQQGYLDIFPFIQTQSKMDIKFVGKAKISRFFNNIWRPFILSIPCKIFSFIIVIGLFSMFFYTLPRIPEGLDQQLATIKDGNLYEYFGIVRDQVESGPQASIIIQSADYKKQETFNILNEFIDLLSQRTTIAQSPWLIWYNGVQTLKDFQDQTFQYICLKNNTEILLDFDKLVDFYLKIDQDHPCCTHYGICGGQFYDDIIFNHQKVYKTKINYMLGRLRTQSDFNRVLRETQQIVDYFKQENKDRMMKVDLDFDIYSFWFVFFEQYSTIKGLTIQNYILSIMILVSLVSILYNLTIAFFLIILVVLMSSNLWSILWLCNQIFEGIPIEINAILLVNFILSIGLSVEFCVHTVVRYNKAKGDHNIKIQKTIEEIVAVVFQGIFLTKLLGLSVLYWSPIPLFVIYYFRVFYAIILICGFYGLIVVPQLLDIFGRYFSNKKTSYKKSLNDYILHYVKDTGDEEDDQLNFQNKNKRSLIKYQFLNSRQMNIRC